jgi:hypothetical protein
MFSLLPICLFVHLSPLLAFAVDQQPFLLRTRTPHSPTTLPVGPMTRSNSHQASQAPWPVRDLPPSPVHQVLLHAPSFLHLTDIHPDPYYRFNATIASSCHSKKPLKDPNRSGKYGVPFKSVKWFVPLQLLIGLTASVTPHGLSPTLHLIGLSKNGPTRLTL